MTACLDHVVLICADLQRTSTWISEETGVEPTYGGVHSTGGTHNALLRLSATCYLEILAPTGPCVPDESEWARLARAASAPRVLTYCCRAAHPLTELAGAFAALGWRDTQMIDGARIRPDGSRVRWRVLISAGNPFGFAFPFFIDWLGSPHPSESLGATGQAGRLRLAAECRNVASTINAPSWQPLPVLLAACARARTRNRAASAARFRPRCARSPSAEGSLRDRGSPSNHRTVRDPIAAQADRRPSRSLPLRTAARLRAIVRTRLLVRGASSGRQRLWYMRSRILEVSHGPVRGDEGEAIIRSVAGAPV